MELRKDPITRSWVITGDDPADNAPRPESACPFCTDSPTSLQVIAKSPNAPGVPWSARSVVHPRPLYRIEGELARRAEGMYDKMGPIGAHEVIIESPQHDSRLARFSDEGPGGSMTSERWKFAYTTRRVRHEAIASVRLVNKDGDVIWSTTQESNGAKFRGASADVADKITKQLVVDYQRLK